jgi:hypothetical protein
MAIRFDDLFLGGNVPPSEGDVWRANLFRIDKDGDRLCWGKVTEMTPFERLAMTFTVGPLDGHMTDIVWTLTEVPGGTRLELEHSGLPKGAPGFGLVLALDKGWDEHLARLRPIAA